MSIFDSIKGLFSGNTNTQGQTTSNGTSTGQTAATGTTANTNTVDPTYGYQVGNTFGAIPGLYDPGRALIQQSAAPVTATDINALRDPTAQAQISALFDPNGALMRSQADQRSFLNGSFNSPYASTNKKQQQDFELRSQVANNATGAGIIGQAWAPAAATATSNAQRVQTAGTGLTGAATQQVGAVPGLVQAGGQTTTGAGATNQTGVSSGTTSNIGTNNSTTSYNPSLASIGLGAAGLYDMYRNASKDGGVIKGYESGGAVTPPTSDFASKVRDAFHVFSELHGRATGGTVAKPMADGGDPWGSVVSPFNGGPDSGDGYWDGVQAAAIGSGNPTRSPYDTSPSMKDRLGRLEQVLAPPKGIAAPTPVAAPMGTDNPSLGALSGAMNSVGYSLRPQFAEGGNTSPSFASTLWDGINGLVGSGSEAPPAPPSAPDSVLRENYGYEKPDARWQLRRGLLGMSSGVPGLPGPFSSFATSMDKELESRAEAAKLLEQHAQLTGKTTTGAPTMQSQQFAETQWKNRLPEYKQIGQSEDGLPIMGWVSPSAAAGAFGQPSGSPERATGAPSAARETPAAGTEGRTDIRSGVPAQVGVLPGPAFGQQAASERGSGLTGEEFLATMPKARADMIRAISEGRERFPENPRNPFERALRREVMQYDPAMDATTYQVRSGVLKDTSSGPTSKNIAAINTAATHAADLYQAIDDLGTRDVWGGQAARHALGNYYEQDPKFKTKLNTFNTKKLALAEELSKAFHGGPSVSGVEEWKKTLDAADSPSALRATVGAAVKLLEGRNRELESNYFRAMGKYPKKPNLSPESKEEYGLIKQAAELNIPIAEMKKRAAQEKSVRSGPAEGERVAKPNTEQLPAATAPAPTGELGTATNPVYPKTPEAAAHLPSGTHFYTPDGRMKVVP